MSAGGNGRGGALAPPPGLDPDRWLEALGRTFWARMNSGAASASAGSADAFRAMGKTLARETRAQYDRLELEARGQQGLDL